MREIDLERVTATLKSLGVQPGDNLLVHSAVQFLGRPQDGVGLYYQALQTVSGPQGSLAVPAFNFAFARGEPYDPAQTPSSGMGVFSEYVRRLPEARRTAHPMQSLAVVGPHADDLARLDTPSAFDPGSAFERLLELDFKLLLLGATVQAASMVHYSEQRIGVPYRYWKEFTGQVRTPAGWETRTYRMYARDLALDPQLDLRPIQTALQVKGRWASLPLNYGRLSLCRLKDFVSAADALLRKDPWALVAGTKETTDKRG